MGTAPACAREALDMVRAGLGYLAAADATQLAAATQAECLRELEQAGAVATAARAAVLAAFTAGQGYAETWRSKRDVVADTPDRDHPGRSHRARRLGRADLPAAPPQGGRGAGRRAGLRVGGAADLPVDREAAAEKSREESDELLAAAAAAGLGLEELASLAAQMCTSGPPSELPDAQTRTRAGTSPTEALKLAVAFGGAGVMHRKVTPRNRRGGRAGAGRARRPSQERR